MIGDSEFDKSVAEVHRDLRSKGWTLSGEHYANGVWYLDYVREGIKLYVEMEVGYVPE